MERDNRANMANSDFQYKSKVQYICYVAKDAQNSLWSTCPAVTCHVTWSDQCAQSQDNAVSP